ncbi:hypothetical protein CALCODRAFT_492076 [Calocera cornea HHB12733]|uniref:F-box domain-containing protein n=1 Tax=Calocera cornea HHB12733 TaxID=1353952 RepID=A0A165INN7_9BASI|nr:hypothetical protein CALCODRAFT_492076 [Calocera cornea HHB12733]
MPALRLLDFSRQSDSSVHLSLRAPARTTVVGSFGALEELRLNQDITTTTVVLNLITGPLRHLECMVEGHITAEAMDRLANTIARLHATLEELELALWKTIPADRNAARWQHMDAIRQCRKLTYLNILSPPFRNAFDFTDSNLAAISQSFPELGELSISWSSNRDDLPQEGVEDDVVAEKGVTLCGLALALQHWPNIKSIFFTIIHAEDIFLPPTQLERIARTIEVTTSSMPMSSPALVAFFLGRWLPNCYFLLEELAPLTHLPETENGKQVAFAMAIVESIRCFGQFVDDPLYPKQFETPAILGELIGMSL